MCEPIRNQTVYILYFVKVDKRHAYPPRKKTDAWYVKKDGPLSANQLLGYVIWHGAWRQYIFEPLTETIWSSGCLKTIEDFLCKANAERRRKKI